MTSRQVRRLAPAVAAGATAAVLSLLFQSPGVVLSHDSWVYWEGSLSLLNGDGYRLLDGTPISSWPPGFSAYLALWQAFLGASAGALAIAQSVAVGSAAGLWSHAALRITGHDAQSALRWSIAVVFAVTFPIHHRVLLSEALFQAILGAVLCTVVAWPAGGAPEGSAPGLPRMRYVAVGLLLSAALLTRNVGLAFVPAFAWLIVAQAREPGRARRGLATAGTCVAAVAVWTAARAGLGQLGSHELIDRGVALRRFERLLVEGVVSCWAIFAPVSPQGIGVALLALLVVATLLARRSRKPDAPGEAASRVALSKHLVVAAGLVFVGTAALIAISVPDPFGPRFVLPVAGLLLVSLAGTARWSRSSFGRGLACGVVACFALIALVRSGYWIERSLRGLDAGLPWNTRLVAPCELRGAACALGANERISPLHEGRSRLSTDSAGELPARGVPRDRPEPESAGRVAPGSGSPP